MDEPNKFLKVIDMKNAFFYLVFLFGTTACLSHYQTTEKAAVVVINNSPSLIAIESVLNGQISPPEPIAAGEASYLLLYEAQSNETELPGSLEGIWVATNNCRFLMDRAQLTEIKTRDDADRAGWNIIITPLLMNNFGC